MTGNRLRDLLDQSTEFANLRGQRIICSTRAGHGRHNLALCNMQTPGNFRDLAREIREVHRGLFDFEPSRGHPRDVEKPRRQRREPVHLRLRFRDGVFLRRHGEMALQVVELELERVERRRAGTPVVPGDQDDVGLRLLRVSHHQREP